MPIDASIIAILVGVRLLRIETFVQFFRRIEVIGETEFLTHVGKEEAVLRLTLEAHWQTTTQEEAFAI
jgi:hypothetical protein